MPAPPPAVEERLASTEPTSSRRPDIQGLRAVAVLMVVAFHAGLPVPGGFVGVDVFFVISGFVITAMLHREWHQNGRIRFGRFYLRRFKRLTPALAVAVSITTLASLLLLSPLGPLQAASKTALGAILLAANFVIARTTGGYFDAPAETNPLLNTWSLSVEEQFYLVFPALIALGWMLARRRGLLRFSPMVIVASVAIASFALATAGSMGLTFHGSGTILGFYSPFTRAWEFAVGALLALRLAKNPRSKPQAATPIGMVGVLLLGASLWTITEATPFPGLWTLLPVTATLLLLLAGDDTRARTTRALSTSPMVKIGDWSYSIYLWHWPFIVFASIMWPTRPSMWVVAAAASVGVAVASYRWLEQPLRVLTLASARQWTLMVTATVMPPLVIAGVTLLVAGQGLGSDRILQFQQATMPLHIGLQNQCDARTPLGQEPTECRWNVDATGSPVYLLGDSNADHFSEGFIQAAGQVNRPITIATTNACPFIDVVFHDDRSGALDETCSRYVQESLNFLGAPGTQRGTVVISNSDSYWDSKEFRAGLTTSKLTNDSARKIDIYEAGLRRTIKRLESAGHQVLLIQTVPHWSEQAPWAPSECSTLQILTGGCEAQRTLTEARTERARTRSALDQAAAATNVAVWDPSQALCPEATCSTQGPGYVRYRDSGHISVPQSESLAPVIQPYLVQ